MPASPSLSVCLFCPSHAETCPDEPPLWRERETERESARARARKRVNLEPFIMWAVTVPNQHFRARSLIPAGLSPAAHFRIPRPLRNLSLPPPLSISTTHGDAMFVNGQRPWNVFCKLPLQNNYVTSSAYDTHVSSSSVTRTRHLSLSPSPAFLPLSPRFETESDSALLLLLLLLLFSLLTRAILPDSATIQTLVFPW